VLVERLLEMM
jgi:hypothetical protein